MDHDVAFERYEAAGFRGDPDWPGMELDPNIESERLRMEELLRWAAQTVREGSQTVAGEQ